ncbi:MFS transporter [Xanthomonas campestris pv. badrii]|uniref:MFS transporter n=1 Tax=Xanthomonas campestris pv. badrii TaxID=149696 RepID=A0A7Z2ZG97_XANCA|nr:MFS transporter [Xanthomonas campestris]MCC4602869.1 MFS transporter [Xanthomonas campestris pv. parthenii]QJD66883.1 MFS transporter [Xanthomonas campestris pv. badrii]
MHAPTASPQLPTLPLSAMLAYTAAHFGKSLLWYTGELLLIFALTEYVQLSATAAGMTAAAGLVVSALMGLLAARRWQASSSLAWAGRAQWRGIAIAAVAMALLFLVPLLPAAVRLACVLLVSLPFRAAYAVGDVAQNTLLGLGRWPWRGAKGISALRLVGSGLAALSVSAAIGLLVHSRPSAGASVAMTVVVAVSTLAMLTAGWLRHTLQPHAHHVAGPPAHAPNAGLHRACWLPLMAIAALSLALPTFTKLAPYLAQTLLPLPRWGSAVLISYAVGTVAIQPLAARLQTGALQRLGCSGFMLVVFGLSFAMQTTRGVWPDAALAFGLGMAAGSASQWVWARHAELSTRHDPAHQARGFALLTAAAQLALALGSVLIGLLLHLINDHDADHAQLAWSMAIGPMLCGAACMLLTFGNASKTTFGQKPPVERAAMP